MKLNPFGKSGIAKNFAFELADSLARRYPPIMDKAEKRTVSQDRLTRVLEDAMARAIAFQQEHRLGFLGKAKLGNEFRWRLKELGYSEQFIEIATEALMVYINKGSKAPTQGVQ